jgi:DNA-binding Lrp family transcriptional regulator
MATKPGGRVTDESILSVIENSGKPFTTTAMIMEDTGLSDQGVRNRLEQLEAKRAVRRSKVGLEWIYWLPDYTY